MRRVSNWWMVLLARWGCRVRRSCRVLLSRLSRIPVRRSLHHRLWFRGSARCGRRGVIGVFLLGRIARCVSGFMGKPEIPVVVLAAYELARSDAEYARRLWVEAGSPLATEASHGGVHALRKALVEADDRLARRVKDLAALGPRRGVGRPQGSASAEDRLPPKVTLRSVDGDSPASAEG